MKFLFFISILFLSLNSMAQSTLKQITAGECENPKVFESFRNNTKVVKYVAADGTILELGDTLVMGKPSGLVTSTENNVETLNGVTEAKSQTKRDFVTITMGKPLGNPKFIKSEAFAKANMQGEKVIISEMRLYHKGSKKKPLALTILLGEPNGRAFGLHKYMTISDYEKSVLTGEIKSLNTPLTREEAIAKLKESKDLLDLGVITKEEYSKRKQHLTPIILKK
ncbi:SHOCT domain-containing protein [Prolixibacter bellariivorans]|nr:SHOCT domain-containing protein [Prolixibacter bellariivorans]